MTSTTHPEGALLANLSDLDRASLIPLLSLNVLSAEQVERLNESGVANCQDLVQKTRDKSLRSWLHRRTGIAQERLLMAGALANMLQIRGPGSITAAALVENSTSTTDSEVKENQEWIEQHLHADRPGLLSLFAVYIEDEKERVRIQGRMGWLMWYPVVSFGLIMLLYIVNNWSHLFPAAAESALDQAGLSLNRSLALSSLGAAAITYGVLAIGLYLLMWATRALESGRIATFLGRVLLSDRDTVVLAETREVAPESQKKWLQAGQRSWNWLALGVFAVGLGGFLLQLDMQTITWIVFVVFIAGVSGLSALDLHMAHKSIGSWNTQWAEQVRLHYVSHTVVASMLRVAIAGGALALALWVAAEVGVRLAVPWASNMAETSKAVFLDGLVTLELEAEDMAMAQDWAERNANALQRALASIASEARGAVADTVDAALNAYIILVAVLTMLAFAAGMYSRGLLAILIPLLWWLSGELIPDTADQIASSQPLAIKFSLAALAVSLVIAILSNVLGKRASQRDERECSECFLLADNDARFCKGCGKPLEGDQPLWG